MSTTPPATVEDMFVQTARGVRTDDGTMTLLGLAPHTIYFSDRPERIVGHLTTRRFLQWWNEGEDSFAVDPPNAVLAWGEPGTDTRRRPSWSFPIQPSPKTACGTASRPCK